MKIKFIALLGVLVLCGCSHLNTTFQCPMRSLVQCKSLDQINRMVLAGQLGRKRPIPLIPHETVVVRKQKRHFL